MVEISHMRLLQLRIRQLCWLNILIFLKLLVRFITCLGRICLASHIFDLEGLLLILIKFLNHIMCLIISLFINNNIHLLFVNRVIIDWYHSLIQFVFFFYCYHLLFEFHIKCSFVELWRIIGFLYVYLLCFNRLFVLVLWREKRYIYILLLWFNRWLLANRFCLFNLLKLDLIAISIWLDYISAVEYCIEYLSFFP